MTDAGQLANHLVNHARSMGCELHEGERAIEIQDKSGHLMVVTDKASYETKAVIIATGMGLFKPKRIGCPGRGGVRRPWSILQAPRPRDPQGQEGHVRGRWKLRIGDGAPRMIRRRPALCTAGTPTGQMRPSWRRCPTPTSNEILSSQVVEIKGTDHVTSVVLDINGKWRNAPSMPSSSTSGPPARP